MKNIIKNYFTRMFNGGWNSYKYVKPNIGSMFYWRDKTGKQWNTNYTKDRVMNADQQLWRYW